MDETTVQYWPKSVPETLWNYGLMQAQQPPPFPFMGLRFESGFLVAFVFGLIFVAFFAWRRFKEKTFDSHSFTYRVFSELDLTVLRGGAAMRRAYMIYAGTLLVLYLGMTFFGKLILETVGQLPIAGAQVDTSGLNFNSPQWPLMLAFGFAGLAPLIPPLEVAETWLRRRAHQAVGIPTRIDQLARRIIDIHEQLSLQSSTPAHHAVSPDGSARPDLPPWVRTHLGSETVAKRMETVYSELQRFQEWSEEEDPDWPNRSMRSDLRRLEHEIAAEARVVLQDYDDVMRQPYDDEPAVNGNGTEQAQARRKQLRHRLDVAEQRMTGLRGDLAAIIAVYAEGDRDFGKISKPEHRDIRETLVETFAFMRIRSGPEVALVVALPAVFLIYLMACLSDLHTLLKPVQLTFWTATVTASLETLRFAAICSLPAVAAFALRFYLLDHASRQRTSASQTPRLTTSERLLATAAGGVTSAILLCLVALLWAAVLSPTSTHFQQLLFRSQAGFLVYFVEQAFTSALIIFWALVACDASGRHSDARRRSLGILCAATVLAWLLRPILTDGLACANPDLAFPQGLLTDKACFRDTGAIDFLVYPVAAFLVCAVFGALPSGVTAPPADAAPGLAPGRRTATGALATVAALLLLAMSASPARSQACADTAGPPCEDRDARCPESCEVTIGFRADAEPFSFLVETDDRKQYQGYLADLCYALFNGSPYHVSSVEVTVRDRFGRIRGAASPAPGEPVDMLCDPLTLRFSKPTQELRGFYSPIVFTSGVTYLLRKTGRPRALAYLGYADNSTAWKVARKACQVDLLRIRDPDEPPRPGECDPPEAGAMVDPHCDVEGAAPVAERYTPRTPGSASAYHFCPKKDHSQLISWFCRGTAVGPSADLDFHMAYFGDREIIQGKLAAYVKQPGHTCPEDKVEADPSNYTYEPYALVVSLERPELAQFVQRRTYEFFSHPGNPRGLFRKHFPKQQMSTALAYLYLLNGVMERDPFTVETIPQDDLPGDPIASAEAHDATIAADQGR